MTLMTHNTLTAWVCSDCIIKLANDEVSPDLSEAEAANLLSLFDGEDVVPGTAEHDDDCGADDGFDCYCDTMEFSGAACEGCGSNYGGTRHAVTVFVSDI